jgi:hypothetical protein
MNDLDQIPRLNILSDEALPEAARLYIAPGADAEIFRTYANFPPFLAWLSRLYAAVDTDNPAGPRVKEMVRLRVATLNDCRL